MAKQPAPGSTKTRLVPPLSHEAAAELYECFLLDALDLARSIAGATPLVAVSPPESAEYFRAAAADLAQIPQIGASLDERLERVLTQCVERGFDQVVALGSDSPTLPAGFVAEAFSRLDDETVDVVLGPTDDGGYYLIGWKERHPQLVRGVEMSTSRVLCDTLARAAAAEICVSQVAGWYDVDEPADLERLEGDLRTPGDCGLHTRRLFERRGGTLGGAARGGARGGSAPGGGTRGGGTPGGGARGDLLRSAAIVPALNEAGNVASLVAELLEQPVEWIVVVDNGSTDDTAAAAAAAGAIVVSEPRRGYGFACAAGSRAALERGADVLVYIDGDHSSRPQELPQLLRPLLDNDADLVLGSRVRGQVETGSMRPHQRFGNWLAAALVRRLYGIAVTDLGPYRAIRAESFERLDMQEMTFGWPTEMAVKSARMRGRIVEVPVSWRVRRSGTSKVSGTVKGSLLAGYDILRVVLRNSRRDPP